MPHKKGVNNIQVFGEIDKGTHKALKSYKQQFSLPIYLIVSLCIYWAMTDVEFETWLIKNIQNNPFVKALRKGGD